MKTRPSKNRRKQGYVHPMQRSYAVGLGIALFLYSLAILALAFFLPYVVPAIKMVFASGLEEEASAATKMLSHLQNTWPALVDVALNIWPAILALIFLFAAASVYVTHGLAGPLYRLEQCARNLAEGNLGIRLRLRKGDHLADVASMTNEAIDNIDRAMIDIREREARTSTAIRQMPEVMRLQPATSRANLDELESIVAESQEGIEEILERFQLSDSPKQPATDQTPGPNGQAEAEGHQQEHVTTSRD